jgi:uncharacterized protein
MRAVRTILRVAALAAASTLPTTTAVLAQETAVSIETPAGALHGTLLVPAGARAPMRAALLVAGSGPTDRDGNTPLLPGKSNSLKLVAEALAARGVASLRYDKRGIGASVGMGRGRTEADLRFTMYADDAAAWLDWLAKDPRFSRLAVIGHSEGSLIGMMAAQRSAKVDRVVSLAGAGRPIADVLDEQLSQQLPPTLLAESRHIMAELKAGRTVDSVSQPLLIVFRRSVQPYFISWLPLDPAAELAKLQVPVLVVQGTTDVQASAADAERLAKASPRATLVMIDGMNHVLKEFRDLDRARQQASYSDSTLALHPRLVETLGKFVAGK